jgi:hypothetical protein
MKNRAVRSPGNHGRKRWPTPSIIAAGTALFIVLGGSAIAASGLIHAGDIAPGAVTSKAIRNSGIEPQDLSMRTRALLQEAEGVAGENGDAGSTGPPGTNGANGANGANGPNGANGANGVDGTDGADGTNGTNGIDGTDGIDGTIVPLSATAGTTALPTASPPTTVVNLAVPAGNYVVLAKTQLSQTGAGDTIDCVLKAGAVNIDQVSMKTLPALAAIPVSLQAVTVTTSPSQLSVECDVLTANGSANFSSLIAIPTG